MKIPKIPMKLIATLAALILVAFVVGRITGSRVPTPDHAEHTAHKGPAKAQMWTCSMHPQIKLPKPGKCPLCGMNLIPLETSDKESGGMRELTISEHAKKLMEIETVPVQRKFVTAKVRMVGKVDYDETRVFHITAWIPGRLDRLFVDYTGVPVKKGDHMVSIYSPELLTAQEELLQALKVVKEVGNSELSSIRETADQTIEAVREKLRLWGLTKEQIAEIEKRGTPNDHMTIYSPSGGIVIHKNAQEGMYVKTGTKIYTISDLSQVWVLLDAYESDLMWLKYGQQVEFTTESYPGEAFTGTIAFIDPILTQSTRTIKVRVNVANADARLKPGMFVRAVARADVAVAGKVMEPELASKWICPMHPDVVKEEKGTCDICEMSLVTTESLGYVGVDAGKTEKPLVIPATATLITGTRAIVFVEVPGEDKPTFEGREIVLGPRAGDYYLVRHGLKEGERVVTKGSFKLDAELQIQAKPSMMTPDGGGGGGSMQGMDHGGKKTMSPEAMKKMAAPSVQIPAIVRSQLQEVASAARAAVAAASAEDLDATRQAFKALADAVGSVDGASLSGKTSALWKEYAMFLGNDGVEGSGIVKLSEAVRVAALTQEHLAAMQKRLGISRKSSDRTTPTVSDEFRNQLGKVVTLYLAVQEALAADNAEKASANAKAALNALKNVDMSLLGGDSHMQWMKHEGQLRTLLSQTAAAKGIDGARKQFAMLSEQMASTVRTFRPLARKTYQFKCPMAFGDQGAVWLQANDETANPYLGKAMPGCGDVTEVISGVGKEGGLEHE